MSLSESFSFGKNWAKFVDRNLDDQVFRDAETSLEVLGPLRGKTFLDVGCGSGLFSFAAHGQGASRVVSFDVDPYSVQTTRVLHERAGRPANWTILEGSILDAGFLAGLEQADVVYAWGSLHHTGQMWEAIRNARRKVAPGGSLFLSIYNRHPGESEMWVSKKRSYNESGSLGKLVRKARHVGGHLLTETMLGNNPVSVVLDYGHGRGMNYFRDVEDWLGGEPYEFATVEEISEFCGFLGLERVWLSAPEGLACNEFVFADRASPTRHFQPISLGDPPEDPRELHAWALIAHTQGVAQGVALRGDLALSGPHGEATTILLGLEARAGEPQAPLPSALGGSVALLSLTLLRAGDDDPQVTGLLDDLRDRYDPASAGWGGDPADDFATRTVLTARGHALPGSLQRIEAGLAAQPGETPSALLREAFSLSRAARQSGHRAREVRDRLQTVADRAWVLLSRTESLVDQAQLVTALAEVQPAVPGWIRSEQPLRSGLDRVPWLPLDL